MKRVEDMTLAEKVGQIIVVGGAIGGLGDDNGIQFAMRLIREKKAGGFYLGYPRYANPVEAWEIHKTLQEASDIPLFICGDMETSLGYIIIDGARRHPYLMGLGAARDESLARECGAITGREARAIGFNWNYGPCVDVNVKKENPEVGIRAFGSDPDIVGRMGAAYIQGCESERVICSAKHFPGSGSLAVDRHYTLGIDHTDFNTLTKVNIPPFRAAIQADVRTVMSTHTIFSAFGDDKLPATFSKRIMTDFLRGELGFRNVTVTDSLSMKAIEDHFEKSEAIIMSFLAGHDVIIVPDSWQPYETLIEAVESGRIPEASLNAAVERVLQLKMWLYPDGYREPDKTEVEKVFQNADTVKTLETLAVKSVTVMENKALPINAGAKKRLFVIQERDETYQYCPWEKLVLDRAEKIIRAREPAAAVMRVSMACSPDESQAVMQAAGESEEVIFFCIAKHLIEQYHGRLSKATGKLLARIAAERTVIGISLGSPYVIEDMDGCAGFICAYGESEISAEMTFKVLYGEIVPEGKLPVTISEKYHFGLGCC